MEKISSKLVGMTFEPTAFEWTAKDVMLYALGVGAKPEHDLDYVYEGKGPRVLPTYAVIPGMLSMGGLVTNVEVNLMMLLHGEQGITLPRALPPEAHVKVIGKVTAVWDKGKAAVIETEGLVRDELGSRFLTDPARAAEVVGMRVRDDDGVHVTQPEARALQPVLERLPGLGTREPGIDHGQTAVVEQPVHVHVPETGHPDGELHTDDPGRDLGDVRGGGVLFLLVRPGRRWTVARPTLHVGHRAIVPAAHGAPPRPRRSRPVANRTTSREESVSARGLTEGPLLPLAAWSGWGA